MDLEANKNEVMIYINPAEIIDSMREKYGKIDRSESIRILQITVNNVVKSYIRCYLDSGCSDHVFIVYDGGRDIKRINNMNIKGVAPTVLKVEAMGTWDIIGNVYVYSGGNINLISVPVLDKMGMKTTLHNGTASVIDKEGNEVLSGRIDETGLYRVDLEINNVMAHTILTNDQIIAGEDFITPEIAERARGCLKMHCNTGHPGDEAFGYALDNGCYVDCPYTSRDLRNGRKLYEICSACAEAKTQAPDEVTHEGVLPPYPGHTLFGDLKDFKVKTLGGNTKALIVRERLVGHGLCRCIKSKNEEDLWKGALSAVHFYNGHGRRVVIFRFDNEIVFKCIAKKLESIGINVGHTPTQMHNKRVEKYIQYVYRIVNTIKCDLDIEIPQELDGEVLEEAINTTNNVPNSLTGPTMTPYQAITGVKPVLRPWKTGQIGLCDTKREDKNIKAEFCIFIGLNSNCIKNLKVYMPQWRRIYSRRVFIPQNRYPATWRLTPRMAKVNRQVPDNREGLDNLMIDKERVDRLMIKDMPNEVIQQTKNNNQSTQVIEEIVKARKREPRDIEELDPRNNFKIKLDEDDDSENHQQDVDKMNTEIQEIYESMDIADVHNELENI
jgi:hypothetical protein